ncbi:hypothetical protein CLF_107291 [Clonorchis sinensis]|uniref:Uncharacterized protein n=1 Tax=Clonorchis sinensis TaxID=79923 RepID=G7YQI4_CLOSI|nr:hypothetical protein CLF_107291 [Clonorchis sinensis]
MLCPAITDPFAGPHYRVMAMVHQPPLILILGKCISCFSLSLSSSPWPWQTSPMMVCQSTTDTSNSSSSSVTSNPGKLHWLNSEPESEMMTLAATPWCWSDLFRYQTYVCDRQLPGKSATYSTGKEVPKHERDPELSPADEVCRRTSST